MDENHTVMRTVVLRNLQGMHMRPAHGFMTVASGFACAVTVRKEDEEVDGKRMLGLMGFAHGGDTLTIRCVGPDAAEAVDALVAYLDGLPEQFNEQRVPPP